MATSDESIAAAIARAASDTGMGFLLARVITDQIIVGAITPDAPEFDRRLYEQAAELLLLPEGAASAESPYRDLEDARTARDRALLHALAIAPAPGIPAGEEWRVTAAALGGVDASLSDQVDLLGRLGRFILEDRDGNDVVYRFFHPALASEFRAQIVGRREGGSLDVIDEHIAAAMEALVTLTLERSNRWESPERIGHFLRVRLPELLASCRPVPLELIADAVAGAPYEVLERQVSALLDASEDCRALGLTEDARDLTNTALILPGRIDNLAGAMALVGQAQSFLDLDMWREARDMSYRALRWCERALAAEPDDYGVLRVALRATRMLGRSLGVGAFDAEDALPPMERLLWRVAGAPPGGLVEVGSDVAQLLMTYADALNRVAPLEEARDAASAASRLLTWLIASGREDLWLEQSWALAHRGIARIGLGDRGGLYDLEEAVTTAFSAGPLGAGTLRKIAPYVSKLVQNLALDGQHERALEWANQIIAAMEEVARTSRSSSGANTYLAHQHQMRAVLLVVLGRISEAVADARTAVALVDAAEGGGESLHEGAALVLVDAGLFTEALSVLDAMPSVPSYGPNLRSSIRALAQAPSLMARNELEAAKGALAGALDNLDQELEYLGHNAFRRFCTFGIELRVAAALASVERAAGDESAAEEALHRGARVFLRALRDGPPRRMLHTHPSILEDYAARLSLFAGAGLFGHAQHEAWGRALASFPDEGREALRSDDRTRDERLAAFEQADRRGDVDALWELAAPFQGTRVVEPERAIESLVLAYARAGDELATIRLVSLLPDAPVPRLLMAIQLRALAGLDCDRGPFLLSVSDLVLDVDVVRDVQLVAEDWSTQEEEDEEMYDEVDAGIDVERGGN